MKQQRIARPSPELKAVWDRIPNMVDCQGKCSISCGPIDASDQERRLPMTRAGRRLDLTQPRCPLLSANGRCTVYSVRPTICRLWGAVEDLPCIFGCKPERMLSRREGWDILASALEIDEERSAMRQWAERASEAELDAMSAYVAIGHRADRRRAGLEENT